MKKILLTLLPDRRFLTDKKEWITTETSIGYNIPKTGGTELEGLYDANAPKMLQSTPIENLTKALNSNWSFGTISDYAGNLSKGFHGRQN